MTDTTVRHALYFAPPAQNPWGLLLSRWLGYDARTGSDVAQIEVPALSTSDLRAITEQLRQYGIHATLKAPFRLAPRRSEQELLQAVDAYAQSQTAFSLPPLQVEQLKNFIALVPARPELRIHRIADACTRTFDRFRAPPTEAEMARRLREPLDARSLALLKQWGYPHVLENFQFHISLTGSLAGYPAQMMADALQAARSVFAPLADVVLPFDAISVFRQAQAGGRFVQIHSAALAP